MTAGGAPLRVFVALTVSQQAILAMESVIQHMTERIKEGVRWVNPEGIHVTLKFLGNVDPSRLPGIAQAMDRTGEALPPFRIGLSGLGVFPNLERPRVLWTGVKGDLEQLELLYRSLEEALVLQGYSREGRAFNPHLTLGRVRDGLANQQRRWIGDIVPTVTLPQVEPWRAEAIHLIQSHLSPAGATYSKLHSTSLGGMES